MRLSMRLSIESSAAIATALETGLGVRKCADIASTSARVGIEGCAPSFVVASAPALFAIRTASGRDSPSAR